MDIDVFPAKDLDTVFSVLRTALRHSGKLTSRERAFLATGAKITGYRLPEADPIALIAAEVHIEGAYQRRRLIQFAAIAALYNSPVTPGTARFLRELCWRLDVSDPVVGVVDAVEKGRRLWARMLAVFCVMRRPTLPDGTLGREYWKHMTEISRGSVSNEMCGERLETTA